MLGPPKRCAPHLLGKRWCLLGITGLFAELLLTAASRAPALLWNVLTFVGFTIIGGAQWRRACPDRERRPVVVALGLGTVGVAVLTAAALTTDHWAQVEPVPYHPAPMVRVPTMIVLCPETTSGKAYSYQTGVVSAPTCRNGAVPKVIARG